MTCSHLRTDVELQEYFHPLRSSLRSSEELHDVLVYREDDATAQLDDTITIVLEWLGWIETTYHQARQPWCRSSPKASDTFLSEDPIPTMERIPVLLSR